MNIGFDAKRAFFNYSGLGNYSRGLIDSISQCYPQNQYFLYTPFPNANRRIQFIEERKNIEVRNPKENLDRVFPSYWRSIKITDQLKTDNIDIYHGLSNELPLNIERSNAKKVVTIHDLIFLRYPEFFPFLDRTFYKVKFKKACENADKIIAISEQTKNDIIEFYKIDSTKIDVVYQTCNSIFSNQAKDNEKLEIKEKYGLYKKFILSVGTIEKRKNLLSLVKAFNLVKDDIPHDLVVIGKETKYFKKVQKFISENGLENRVRVIRDVMFVDFPIIYQIADAMIYPSLFEGFGIPIIEALFSKTPVITTNSGCFPEAGGPDSIYVDSNNIEELQTAIINVLTDDKLRMSMIDNGFKYVQQFKHQKVSENLMNVYQSL
ncbi:MAG: hypothetical protein COC01_03830 [Bacteroidetes bacterium]|nr:glycosyltransferase family 4 protein [Bacteroidia bacterium]PCH68401.1 MAG: hypothetical protein COC01_03830 [Bacteroidota bacterium]